VGPLGVVSGRSWGRQFPTELDGLGRVPTAASDEIAELRLKNALESYRTTLCRLSMSNGEPRITGPTLKVLGALLLPGHEELSGADISRATKLASGTLYPILFRLERIGWLESRWEDGEPKALGRPRRRLYRVTELGAQSARAALKDIVEPAFGRVAWA
jgi:PadR family transcriptional regulator, regulatory protein PadR